MSKDVLKRYIVKKKKANISRTMLCVFKQNRVNKSSRFLYNALQIFQCSHKSVQTWNSLNDFKLDIGNVLVKH